MGKELPLIAGRLKGLRESAGMSQQDLAVKAGLSLSIVAQIEQGKKADPRMSTVVALAAALSVDVGDLVSTPPAKPAAPKKPRGRKWG